MEVSEKIKETEDKVDRIKKYLPETSPAVRYYRGFIDGLIFGLKDKTNEQNKPKNT